MNESLRVRKTEAEWRRGRVWRVCLCKWKLFIFIHKTLFQLIGTKIFNWHVKMNIWILCGGQMILKWNFISVQDLVYAAVALSFNLSLSLLPSLCYYTVLHFVNWKWGCECVCVCERESATVARLLEIDVAQSWLQKMRENGRAHTRISYILFYFSIYIYLYDEIKCGCSQWIVGCCRCRCHRCHHHHKNVSNS